MMRLIYNILWPLGLVLFLPGYLVKMFRRGGYREKFGQRLGFYGADLRTRLARQRSTWLHAVSVGEVAIALKLAPQLRLLERELHCVLTVTTTTGFAFASKNAPDWIEVMYTPLDFWPVMRRAFKTIRPSRIVLIEAEVWPNLVARAHAERIPVVLVNARLSPRSENRFRQFRFAVAPTFGLLDLVCVQEREDIERWAALGVKRERIHHVGSIKFDPQNEDVDLAPTAAAIANFRIDQERPVILGGSTHAGEEEILGEIYRTLREEVSGLLLILAPRHIERTGEVQRKMEGLDLKAERRTAVSSLAENIDCLILDSTGELRSWYAMATVVFMGKSLTARGGQNPVEAIVAGKPTIFGPHMENFAALARALIREGGAVQVNSSNELERAIVDLLRNPAARAEMVRKAREVVESHRGATVRTAKLIVDLAKV